ncbi:MAG: PTS glucose transporter subunit IIA [Selenomonas sp.]|uniref:PTS sugar transporter subunit IIA n=1 Tax=Selenomonas sp. TaxID=2053611 RepID=UPI0025DE771F|nr:PTS glucose transporter subunit IIA [Selenomonas sp.]MCR5438337.1 PTS glucose transporter subunit IIA [Selenomonas sp.]
MTKQQQKLIAPISGRIIDLAKVPDPVFSEKLTGDGLAVLNDSDTVLSPCDGEISLFFDTKHAFAVTRADGVQILVHIGLDTVIMNGEGITQLHHRGDYVKAGEPILKLDLPLLQRRKINLISPILVVNYDTVRNLRPAASDEMVAAGTDVILTYEK